MAVATAAVAAGGHEREGEIDGDLVPCSIARGGGSVALDQGVELSQLFQAELALVFQHGSQGGQMIDESVSWSGVVGGCEGHRGLRLLLLL